MKAGGAAITEAGHLAGRTAIILQCPDLPFGAGYTLPLNNDCNACAWHTTAIGQGLGVGSTATSPVRLRRVVGRTADVVVGNRVARRATRIRPRVVGPARSATRAYERLLRQTTAVGLRHLPDRATCARIRDRWWDAGRRGKLTGHATRGRMRHGSANSVLRKRRSDGTGCAVSWSVKVELAGAVGLQRLRRRTETIVRYDLGNCRVERNAGAVRHRNLTLRATGSGARLAAGRATSPPEQTNVRTWTKAVRGRRATVQAHAVAVRARHLEWRTGRSRRRR